MKKSTAPLFVFFIILLLAFAWHAAGGIGQAGDGGTASAGDANGDGRLDISDPIYLLRYLFSDGPPPALSQRAETSASDVLFDPTGSSLTAKNIQSALLELDQKVTSISGGLQTFDTRLKALEGDVEIDLVSIPPGTFIMGMPPGFEQQWSDIETLHKVNITKGFKLGKTEVTQAQFRAIMGWNPSLFAGCPQCPVENVNWYDVQEFCRLLTLRHLQEGKIPEGAVYRLPTESEWEYACRAGTTTFFFFGEEKECLLENENFFCPLPDEYLWWIGNNSSEKYGPKPVGQKKPNPWGLYDMLGNVWEWCQDRYGPYPKAEVTDPQGPTEGSQRIARGGSWSHALGFARSSGWRLAPTPQSRSDSAAYSIGFRVVLELSQ